jgi:phosphoribosylformylglycinamidine (FGAM) synthase-like enzyme
MVLAVPEAHLERLAEICVEYEVEFCDLGRFGTDDRSLILRYHGEEIGHLPMSLMHDGIPMPTREAIWDPAWTRESITDSRDGDTPPFGIAHAR